MSGTPWCERSAGLLLHLTSLPGGRPDGEARRFAERIAAAGLKVWQILPTGPSAAACNPFEPASAFAGDPAFVTGTEPVDPRAFARFREENEDWLEDWALFAALKVGRGGEPWWRWPAPLRRRDAAALTRARSELAEAIAYAQVTQFRFDCAWTAFHGALRALGLRLFGDLPFFLSRDSADVWAHRGLFDVDADGRLESIVGVPPDAFSGSGQLWGMPPYRWDAMAASGYAWWKRRFELQARRHDLLRLDHFRGFAASWHIPPDAKTAAAGAWVPGPGRAPIDAIVPLLGSTRLVAEDLGVITEDVVALRRALALPGMRVLQFAFDGNPDNPHLPQHHGPDTVCYTGTHDNDTTLGWWRSLPGRQQAAVARAIGTVRPEMPLALIELAWSSPAPLAIVPFQDLLGLDSAARMNRPGVKEGNWRWSFRWDQVPGDFEPALREALGRHDRLR